MVPYLFCPLCISLVLLLASAYKSYFRVFFRLFVLLDYLTEVQKNRLDGQMWPIYSGSFQTSKGKIGRLQVNNLQKIERNLREIWGISAETWPVYLSSISVLTKYQYTDNYTKYFGFQILILNKSLIFWG